MTDHLPECLHSRPCERAVRGTGDRHVVSGGRCDNCDDPCICPALRACTVRVLGEAREAIVDLYALSPEIEADFQRTLGGQVALDRHRERERKTLAAIDRLAQEAP